MANPAWFITKPDSPEISVFPHLITSQQKGRLKTKFRFSDGLTHSKLLTNLIATLPAAFRVFRRNRHCS